MKKYIKPEINVVPIVLENAILTGSTSAGIGEGPATDPALSKGNNLFGEEDDEEDYFGAPKRSSTSQWGD